MIIWSGLGFLVAVIVFGCLLACEVIMDSLWGKGYYSSHDWTIGMGLLAAAPIVWVIWALLRKRKARTVIDKETGQEIILDRGNHSMFFVPLHLWGPLLIVISLVLFVVELIRGK